MSNHDLESDELSAATDLGSTADPRPSAERAPPKYGDVVGRYLVLERIGAGAMGVVLSAYDPGLDRKVALKLLKTLDAGTGTAHERLKQEAQALAKLDHRNVVTVFDVGVHDGLLFVAMELVDGLTLRDWLAQPDQPRSWAAIVDVFMQAGRGLAAAHAAGLIHRDFKPDNVMIGRRGRARVMDFGLARFEDIGEPAGDMAHAVEDEHGAVTRLTQTGKLLGTPAYMSLEQLENTAVTAASDQFSFCVALYEALYGERPFAGDNMVQLWDAVKRGAVRPAPKQSSVPSWLRKVVLRGLAPQPQQRYPSMQALLAALANDPRTRRRKRLLGAGLAAALVAGSWAGYVAIEQETRACAHMDEHLVGVWDDERRAAVEAAIAATGLDNAASTWSRVEALLDAHTAAWVAARHDACEATRRGEQSELLLDRRMACLDTRLVAVRTLVDALARADSKLVIDIIPMIHSLPKPDHCNNLQALMQEIEPPQDPIVAVMVKALDERLQEAKTLESLGQVDESMDELVSVLAEATSLGYKPLEARARLLEGTLQKSMGELDKAVTTLQGAFDMALSLRMIDEAAEAASILVYVLGVDLAQFEAAHRWAMIADPLSHAAGTDLALSIFHYTMGIVALQESRLEAAREHLTKSLSIDKQRVDDPQDLHLATTLVGLGNVELRSTNYEAATGYYQQALAIFEEVLGPDHPSVAAVHNNLGVVAFENDNYEDAQAHHDRAYAIRTRIFAPHSPECIESLLNMGGVADSLGDPARARSISEDGLARAREHLGARHPYVGMFLANLGNLAFAAGDLAAARTQLEAALAIFEELGEDHPFVASGLSQLANVVEAQGDLDEARRLRERAASLTGTDGGSADP